MLIGKNKWKMGKKALCLIFAFLFSLESFAAIVSDNDGAAFVTKAEFEALKEDFASQIDNYNSSIDNKIDGAIGSYLAGIKLAKVSTEKFPVCGGEELLVVNTKNINNLQFGKVGMDWIIHITMIWSLVYGTEKHNGSNGTITMSRTGDDNYEAFIIDNDTEAFKYYGNKLGIDTEVNFCQIKATNNGAAYYDDADALANLRLRWGANPYGKATHGETEDIGAAGQVTWSNYFGNNTFFAVYATGLNWGNLYYGSNATVRNVFKNNISTVTIGNDKIKWIIDDSDAATTIWVKDPEKNPQALTLLAATNYVTTDRQSTFPSDAGVTGRVSVASINYDLHDGSEYTPTWDGRRKQILGDMDITWTDTGAYNSLTTPASGSSSPWNEFHLVTNSKTPSTLINSNYSTDILNTYAPYGFHGYITEGIPVGEFRENTSLEFDLDTTGWSKNLNIGVSNAPFNTDNVANMPACSNIELYIDDIKQSKPVAAFVPGIHTIKIKSIDAQPLFVKLAMPRGSSPKDRNILIWPREYTLIDES